MTQTRPHLLLLAGLLAVTAACQKGPYIELGGKKLTESDLKSEMSDRYKSMKEGIDRQYRSQVQSMLQELAHKKMIEKEAKEKGMSVDDYMASVQKDAALPTPEQVEAFHEQLKSSGQLPPGGQDIRADIIRYLAQQNREQAIQTEIARLKKKYGYHVPYERTKVEAGNRPSRGGQNAKVTIIEYSDFECPFCIKAQATTQKLREKYGDRVRWTFKNFPLEFHANAMGAHLAANCIYHLKPDSFWPFFDGVFSPGRDKKTLQAQSLKERAVKLGVDAAKYDACVKDPAMKKEIEDDIAEGGKIGVTGTPAFFINGRMISGAQPPDAFIEIIEEELAN